MLHARAENITYEREKRPYLAYKKIRNPIKEIISCFHYKLPISVYQTIIPLKKYVTKKFDKHLKLLLNTYYNSILFTLERKGEETECKNLTKDRKT